MLKKKYEFDGIIHFLGIGGIGVSAIAKIMHNVGYVVQGSDVEETKNTQDLEKIGIKVFIGHDAKNIKGATVICYSSAIDDNNPEILEAKKNNIPVYPRSRFLNFISKQMYTIAISGAHGKTTTTSLLSQLLFDAGEDPTILVGGNLRFIGSNSYVGKSDLFVLEADESDKSFLDVCSSIVIVTNIELDHTTMYENTEEMKEAFKQFIDGVPFYGVCIACIDNDNLWDVLNDLASSRPILTYGIERSADVVATNMRMQEDGTVFDFSYSYRGKKIALQDVFLPMYGMHNILNALPCMAAGIFLGLDAGKLKEHIAKFAGVARRFTHILEFKEKDILIMEDYAHHPTEIINTIDAFKQKRTSGRLVVIFEPHRYSRLKAFFKDFVKSLKEIDLVFIMPVFTANEEDIYGVSSVDLAESIANFNKVKSRFVKDKEVLLNILQKEVIQGDTVVFMGAGDINGVAKYVAKKLGEEWKI